MHPALKNTLALFTGFLGGSLVNMGIITLSSNLIPPPESADVTTMEGLRASMHLFQPKHFILPFFAHSLGTFVGACITGLLAVSHKIKFALTIGFLFLAGGIVNTILLPSPLWFSILDLLVAYLPMGFLAGKISEKRTTA